MDILQRRVDCGLLEKALERIGPRALAGYRKRHALRFDESGLTTRSRMVCPLPFSMPQMA